MAICVLLELAVVVDAAEVVVVVVVVVVVGMASPAGTTANASRDWPSTTNLAEPAATARRSHSMACFAAPSRVFSSNVTCATMLPAASCTLETVTGVEVGMPSIRVAICDSSLSSVASVSMDASPSRTRCKGRGAHRPLA